MVFSYKVPPHVEVYKLSTGVWQDITHVSPYQEFLLLLIPVVYVNGASHWVAVASELQNKIVLFDVHEEKFRDIMVPDSLVAKPLGCLREKYVLSVSDESLCLADRSFGNDTIVDIWLMKDIVISHISFNVDVVDEFYSRFHGGRQPQVTHFLETPIASRKNGEILRRADNKLLVSYGPTTEKIKNLGIHNADSAYIYAFHVHTYKESLMLLGKQTDYFVGDTCKDSSNYARGRQKMEEEVLKGRR